MRSRKRKEKIASASFRFLIAVCQGPRDPRERNRGEAINNGRNYAREREREPPSPIHRYLVEERNRIDFGEDIEMSLLRLRGDNTPRFPSSRRDKRSGVVEGDEMERTDGAERSESLRERVWADRVVTLARLSAVRDPISLIIIIQLYVGTAYREYSLVPCYYPVLSAASPARNRGSTTRKTALPPYRYMLLLIIFHRRNWRLRFVYAMGTSRGYN